VDILVIVLVFLLFMPIDKGMGAGWTCGLLELILWLRKKNRGVKQWKVK